MSFPRVKAALAAAALGFCAFAGAAHAEAPAPPPPTRPIPYAALSAPAAAPGDVEGELISAARANGLDPALVRAVAEQESGFRPEARSHRGAMGVMQLTADTARDLGVDPRDIHQNIQGGAAYLRSLLVAFGGDVAKALAAYNAGPGAVERYNGVPPFAETRNYVSSIMGRLAARAALGVVTPLPAQAAQVAAQAALQTGAHVMQAARASAAQSMAQSMVQTVAGTADRIAARALPLVAPAAASVSVSASTPVATALDR